MSVLSECGESNLGSFFIRPQLLKLYELQPSYIANLMLNFLNSTSKYQAMLLRYLFSDASY